MHIKLDKPMHMRSGVAFFIAVCLVMFQERPGCSAENAPSDAVESKTADVVIAVGAIGEPAFQEDFTKAATAWKDACEQIGLAYQIIASELDGLDSSTSDSANVQSDRDRLLAAIQNWQKTPTDRPRWLVFIGHGTANRKDFRFNLSGPDVSDIEVKEALQGMNSQLVVACCFSASGAWLPALTGPNRVIITATKNASEINYSRFAVNFAQSINDQEVDLDHDKEVSLLEAFLAASHRTQQFYEEAQRLTTENALLEDNGDGKGTSANFYDGLRVVGKTEGAAEIDGNVAKRIVLVPSDETQSLTPEQIAARDELEGQLESLRSEKLKLAEDDYYARLERILLQLYDVYNREPDVEAAAE